MNECTLKSGWEIVKFGDVVRNSNLVEHDPEAAGIDKIVGLDDLDSGNLHIRRWDTDSEGTSFTRKFTPGQTLFGKRRAYQHKVAYAEFEGVCSSDILTFESKDKNVLLPPLLPFICQTDSFFEHALGTSAGSLSPRTSWGALSNFEFALPAIEEQKRIAELLWAADAPVQCYEDVLKTALIVRKRKLSILGHPDGHLVAQRGFLGDHVDRIVGGGTPARNKQEYWDGDIPWMTVKDLSDSGHVHETQEHISEKGLEHSATHLVEKGSVILATRISVGKVVMNEVALAINQDLKAVYPSKDLIPQFLFYWLQSMEGEIWNRSAGTTVRGIRLEILKSIPLFLPELSVQVHMADELGKIDSMIAIEEENHLNAARLERELINATIGAGHV